jgi:hypothetical protein
MREGKAMANDPDLTGSGFNALTNFVLQAVQLGALGFGAVLFVLVFLIIIRNQPAADPGIATLRRWFLTLGVAAFIFAGGMQLVTLFFGPKPAGAYKVSVVFAPDPATNALPEPAMRILPVNTTIMRNTPFTVDRDMTLSIGVDEIVQKTRNLTQTAQALTTVNETLSAQAAKVVESGPQAALAPAEIRQLDALNDRVQRGLTTGDFRAAAASSLALKNAAMTATNK